jgi:hypothetical protein
MILAGYQFPHGTADAVAAAATTVVACSHLGGSHKLRRVMLGAAGSTHHDRNKQRFLLPNTTYGHSWSLR